MDGDEPRAICGGEALAGAARPPAPPDPGGCGCGGPGAAGDPAARAGEAGPAAARVAVAARVATLADRRVGGTARAAALRWLGAHAPGALGPECGELLRDPDLELRAAATVVLRAAADPDLVRRARLSLRELVMGGREERHAGLRAAAEIGNPTLAPRLLPYLDDPDPETRRLTLLALAAVPPGLLGPGLFRPPALAALDDPDEGVRRAAGEVLSRGS